LVAGTIPSAVLNLAIEGITAPSTRVENSGANISASLTSTLQRFSHVRTLNNAGTNRVNSFLEFGFNNGAVVDFTLRIAATQLEQGPFVSPSWIPTDGAAATRASDNSIISTLSNIRFNPTQGTMIVEAETIQANSSVLQGLVGFSNNTFNNRMSHLVGTTGNNNLFAATGGATQYNGGSGVTLTDNTVFKSGFVYSPSNFFTSCNGSTALGTTTFIVPTVSQLEIGRIVNSGSSPLFGWVRDINYFSTQLSNPQLQALTT
jgi:hypothetical protein